MTTTRRKGRERITQILYAIECKNHTNNSTNIFKKKSIYNYIYQFTNYFLKNNHIDKYSLTLILGLHKNMNNINKTLALYSKKWKINRISIINKNILQIATCEILYYPELNYKIIINEAIEISKKFGTQSSFSFINGVLDGIIKKIFHNFL